MKVYIAMPITHGHDRGYDYVQMYAKVAKRLKRAELEPVLPIEGEKDRTVWVYELENLSFREACAELVRRNLDRLRAADAVLALLPFPSVGVAMEIAYGKMWGKYVVVATSLGMLYHPWVWYHADQMVWADDVFGAGLEEALQYLVWGDQLDSTAREDARAGV